MPGLPFSGGVDSDAVSDGPHPSSPWGDPAGSPAAAGQTRPNGQDGSDGPGALRAPSGARSATRVATPTPPAGLAPSGPGARDRDTGSGPKGRAGVPTVRFVPRTSIWARIRAAVVLAVITVSIGVAVAAAIALVVWGVASAIHHVAGS